MVVGEGRETGVGEGVKVSGFWFLVSGLNHVDHVERVEKSRRKSFWFESLKVWAV